MRQFRGFRALRASACPEPIAPAQAWGWRAQGQAAPRRPAETEPPRLEPMGGSSRSSAKTPEQRAVQLLRENLTPPQRGQFAASGCFDVVGGRSGKRYRLWSCRLQNIEELDADGSRVRVWCFHPSEALPLGDVLLAQKTALELFEYDALRIANSYSDFAPARMSDAAARECFLSYRYFLS